MRDVQLTRLLFYLRKYEESEASDCIALTTESVSFPRKSRSS